MRLRSVLIWLVLGLVVNVAVAASLGVMSSPIDAPVEPVAQEAVEPLWDARVGVSDARLWRGERLSLFGASELVLVGGVPRDDGPAVESSVYLLDAGFPLHALRGEASGLEWPERVSGAIANPFGAPEETYVSGRWTALLPLSPLWPGVAVNTIVWTIALWLVVGVPRIAWRRFRRPRRAAGAAR